MFGRRSPSAYLSLGAAVVVGCWLSGCGPDLSPAKEESPITFAEVDECLSREVPVAAGTKRYRWSVSRRDLDIIGKQAGDGAGVIKGDGQKINVVVQLTASDARVAARGVQKLARAYAEAFDVSAQVPLYVKDNVLVYSRRKLDSVEVKLLEGCSIYK